MRVSKLECPVRLRLIAAALIASFASACATTSTPVCRAPMPDEMEAFRAIISHNPNQLAQVMAPGEYRTALQNGNAELMAYIWGANGQREGSVLSMLMRPPLCVQPAPVTEASVPNSREILVYPQARYDALVPVDPALATPLPWGVEMRDYLTCRFEETESGWKLADACGFNPRYALVAG